MPTRPILSRSVSVEPLIEQICDENEFSSAPRLPDDPRIGDRRTEWPATVDVHETLVKGAIERKERIGLLAPTLKHYYVDILTLSALFKLKHSSADRRRVLVMSAEPPIRQRFMKLEPPFGAPWSEAEFPIGTVKHNGSVLQKTENYANEDAPPLTLFCRHLHHLPSQEIGRDIGCVIYDESVNFKWERWKRFQSWLEDCDVPSVVYCLRDPVGPVYRSIEEQAPIWAWPPALLDTIIDIPNLNVAADGGVMADTRMELVCRQIENKITGVKYDIHTISEGEQVDRFEEVWDQIDEMETIQDTIRADELRDGIRALKRTVSAFSNVVASIGFTEQCYREQWELRTLSQWIDLLDYHYEQIRDGDGSAPASGEFNNAIVLLEEILEDWESFKRSELKEGHLQRIIQGALDAGEMTLVVVPDEGARQALHLDLQAQGGKMYRELDEQLRLETPDTLPDTDTGDRLVLYGPPSWGERWLLRCSHAPKTTILAYQHQLPLLHYQVSELNTTLDEATNNPLCKSAIDIVSNENPTAPMTDQVSIRVPQSGQESESKVARGYEVIDSPEPTSVDEIIGQVDTNYGRNKRQRDTDNEEEQREQEPVSCYRLHFDNDRVMHVRPDEPLYVVTGDDMTKKSASRLRVGDTIVDIQQTESLRKQLYTLIKQQSEHRLIFHAELWKIKLKNAIEERDDSLDDFIERLRAHGIDHHRQTFRRWYNFEINHTREYEDMQKIAEAYDLDVVKENLEDIWSAAQQIETMYRRLLRELRKRAIQAVVDDQEDIILSEEYDIRLSDFDTMDEHGEQIVKTLDVIEIEQGLEVDPRRLNRLESI